MPKTKSPASSPQYQPAPVAEKSPSPKFPPIPPKIEAATVILFDGLWYDVTFTIHGGQIIDKTVGPGDLMRMSVERAVAKLVSAAERQRDGRAEARA